MSPELSQLIELQELDIEIQHTSDRLSRIPEERDRTESEFKQHAAEFLDLKSKHQQSLEDRKQLEAELATTQQHHEKFERDKTRVQNEKEYTAVLREIDTARKHVSSLETDILKRMEEIETLDVELAARAPDVERMRAEVDVVLAALDKEHEEASRRLLKFGERRKKLAGHMPRHLSSNYERLSRLGRGQALAEVRSNGICLACRVRVRPKIFSDVRKGDQLIICENCGRILYYRDETSQSAGAAPLD
ncbi:MAG TPA: C4-type zinc ribbon domain-containing protein [Blastocatellia bacterium]|nr:C4-type zinc ribbon domain-containing protein [Blastocatellia bacterium]